MIKGVHTMFYSSAAEEMRTFLRDKIGFEATDIGGGWLIFKIPEADMGCHPADASQGAPSGMQDISFYCDDIEETVKELKAKGVKFKGEIEDHGYGLVTYFQVPGDFYIQLYEPKY
jgi:catechol 2,3-dioxygenase-like lactoylglutathione lyase family enzyme